MTPFNISQTVASVKSRPQRLMGMFHLLQCSRWDHHLKSKPVPKNSTDFSSLNVKQACEGLSLADNSCPFRRGYLFLNSVLTEGSDRYYTPREEETNEIERQQSQVHDAHVRTRADDSDTNEVVSTQQMCKASSALFPKTLKFTEVTYPSVFY